MLNEVKHLEFILCYRNRFFAVLRMTSFMYFFQIVLT